MEHLRGYSGKCYGFYQETTTRTSPLSYHIDPQLIDWEFLHTIRPNMTCPSSLLNRNFIHFQQERYEAESISSWFLELKTGFLTNNRFTPLRFGNSSPDTPYGVSPINEPYQTVRFVLVLKIGIFMCDDFIIITKLLSVEPFFSSLETRNSRGCQIRRVWRMED